MLHIFSMEGQNWSVELNTNVVVCCPTLCICQLIVTFSGVVKATLLHTWWLAVVLNTHWVKLISQNVHVAKFPYLIFRHQYDFVRFQQQFKLFDLLDWVRGSI